MAPYMRQIVDSGRYPQLNRYIVEGDDDVEPELAFEQGLDRLLVGLAATLPAPSGPA
jgi:hypothetical protein